MELEQAKEQLLAANSALEKTQDARSQAETALEGELKAVYSKNRDLEEKLNKSQNDLQTYRRKTKEAIKKSTAAQKSSQEAHDAMAEKVEASELQLQELTAKIAGMEADRDKAISSQSEELREQISSLRKELEAKDKELEAEHSAVSAAKEAAKMELQQDLEQAQQKLSKAAEKHAQEVKKLRAELRARSERARQVIQEKDKEMKLLLAQGGEAAEDRERDRDRRSEVEILKLAKQQAGRDIEIHKLKREINALREEVAQRSSDLASKEEVNMALEQKVQQLEDLESRRAEFQSENAEGFAFNFEYLKNIVYSFMMSKNPQEQTQVWYQVLLVVSPCLHSYLDGYSPKASCQFFMRI